MPKRWEPYNNRLFVRVARDYRWVRVTDWRRVTNANPKWLSWDHIHLTPPGARGYSTWLARQIAA